mgnify:CR=1 FL=1
MKAEDLKSLFKTIDFRHLPEIAANFVQETEFEEEDDIFEDAKDMFLSNVPKIYH